jgi:PAS domain S-box-containing protein
VATDAVVRSAEGSKILGLTGEPMSLTRQQVLASVHPDDRAMFTKAVEKLTPENPTTQITYRVLRHNDAAIWLEKTARAFFDEQGRMLRMIGMVVDVTERKQAEEALRESEKRFRLVADTAPALIWMSGTDKLCTFFNKAWLEFTGRSMEQEWGEGGVSGVHPEDLERCLRIYRGAFDARVDFEMEYRLRRFDGSYRWIVDYGVPRAESDGTFLGYIGSCVDITERKLTAQSLEDLSGRLITSQEEERARIARELHDDFTQRLALQGIGLTQVWKGMAESETEGRAKIQDLIKENREILSDMHVLSRQLHSSRLEHVGLAPALAGLCEEMSSKYNIEIEFTQLGVSSEIPKDVALCLFRIAQEALGNVVKHSHVKQAQAELRGADNEIRLRVVDVGAGFDPRVTDTGIGLVSMRERLRLVGGTLSVRSAPSKGTEILAQVPLSAQMSETQRRTRAAGE